MMGDMTDRNDAGRWMTAFVMTTIVLGMVGAVAAGAGVPTVLAYRADHAEQKLEAYRMVAAREQLSDILAGWDGRATNPWGGAWERFSDPSGRNLVRTENLPDAACRELAAPMILAGGTAQASAINGIDQGRQRGPKPLVAIATSCRGKSNKVVWSLPTAPAGEK